MSEHEQRAHFDVPSQHLAPPAQAQAPAGMPPPYVSPYDPPAAAASAPPATPPRQGAASSAAIAAASGEPVIDEHTVKLTGSYEAHGEPLERVRFREPLGDDIAKHGIPLRFISGEGDDEIEFKLVAPVISNYIVALSHPPLPKSTVKKFNARDWNACSRVIAAFFQ